MGAPELQDFINSKTPHSHFYTLVDPLETKQSRNDSSHFYSSLKILFNETAHDLLYL